MGVPFVHPGKRTHRPVRSFTERYGVTCENQEVSSEGRDFFQAFTQLVIVFSDTPNKAATASLGTLYSSRILTARIFPYS